LPARKPEGPPPPPVVQRLRIRYAKRDRLRFISHRDVARAFERAIRRAGLPIALSAGFTPHPKVSWLGAAPTGVASEAEYVEIGLATACDPVAVGTALDASLPPGLDVVECVEAATGAFADRIAASEWEITLEGVDVADVDAALAAFLAADQVLVERRTKDGRRPVDARSAVVSARVSEQVSARLADEPPACAIIHLVARQTTPAVRPDDVLAALRAVAGLELSSPPKAVRLAQGELGEEGEIVDPLAPDRAAGSMTSREAEVGA
jgi:radical SAM-linked protein